MIRCGGGVMGVSNRVVQMQYRTSTATALDSWDAYAGRSIREGERGGGGGQWVGLCMSWISGIGEGMLSCRDADGGGGYNRCIRTRRTLPHCFGAVEVQ